MDKDSLLGKITDTISVRRAFGEPVERDGLLVIPVAAVMGGGGGGDGQTEDGKDSGGGGFGTWVRPLGVYTIRGEQVRFQPAIDVVPLVATAGVFLTVLLRARRRRRPR